MPLPSGSQYHVSTAAKGAKPAAQKSLLPDLT
jgi:hypothetical protein